jgi:hypothetical protein
LGDTTIDSFIISNYRLVENQGQLGLLEKFGGEDAMIGSAPSWISRRSFVIGLSLG